MFPNEYVQSLQKAWSMVNVDELASCVKEVHETLLRGELVLIAGNGGSASTASHFVNDWSKGLSSEVELPIRAISLSDNVSLITAVGNDASYDEIFSFQLENYLGLATLLICISGSGNSRNILSAALKAKQLGMKVIGLVGFDGGNLLPMCSQSFHCKVDDMQIVEDMHLSFGHMVLRTLNNH